jgi:hypothetical protein
MITDAVRDSFPYTTQNVVRVLQGIQIVSGWQRSALAICMNFVIRRYDQISSVTFSIQNDVRNP